MLGLIKRKQKKIKKYMLEGAVIIDVRSKYEFDSAHFTKSINIPLNNIPKLMGYLDKDKPIITCCTAGRRSKLAQRMLTMQGFEVINGGAWEELHKYGV